MKEQRADVFFFYHQKREALVRVAFFFCGFFLLLGTLARVRGGKLNDPWQILGGAIDNGYLLVFGPAAITICVAWYYRIWTNCLNIRESILKAVESGDLGREQLNELEQTLIKPPTGEHKSNWLGRLQTFCLPRTVSFFGLTATILLLVEYFKLVPRKDPELGWTATIFGIPPYTDGFDPVWSRFPELDLPWIYPPWYSILYLAMVSYLVAKIVFPVPKLSE